MKYLMLFSLLLAGAQAAAQGTDSNGFLQHWLLLEPLPVSGQLNESMVRAAVLEARAPAKVSPWPHNGDTVMQGDRRLHWRRVDTTDYNVNLYHFAHDLGMPTSNVLFQLATAIEVPRGLHNVRLAIGSNSASLWYVDGVEVTAIFNERQTVIDDGVSKRLALTPGRHLIQGLVINAGGATDFAARFIDEGGNPVRDFIVNPDP